MKLTKDQTNLMLTLLAKKIDSAVYETQIEMNERADNKPIGDIPDGFELAHEFMNTARRMELFDFEDSNA